MAQTFVLGPNAARGLKKLLRPNGSIDSRDSTSSGVTEQSEFVHPYYVQWSESNASLVIWLPPACRRVSGTNHEASSELTAATGYPSGWYKVPVTLPETGLRYLTIDRTKYSYETPGPYPYFQFYLRDSTNVSSGAETVVATIDCATKTIKQTLTTALDDGSASVGYEIGLTSGASADGITGHYDITAKLFYNHHQVDSDTTTLAVTDTTGGGGGGGGGGSDIVLVPGSGIVIKDANGNSVQTTSGETGPFTIEAVYV